MNEIDSAGCERVRNSNYSESGEYRLTISRHYGCTTAVSDVFKDVPNNEGKKKKDAG
jgi:hypothetical protein